MTGADMSPPDRELTPPLGQQAKDLLERTIRGLVASEASVTATATSAQVSSRVQAWLDDLLSKQDTYRDGALTLLAFPVAAGAPLDVTLRIPGDRAAAGHLEHVLRDLRIPCRRDALQTIAKGSSTFVGRARASWNDLLAWASREATVTEIEQAFYVLARAIAGTARSLPPMPTLDVSKLTFQAVIVLLDELLSTRSGGAYEQFVLAALLYAVAEEEGGRRVETKSLNASDASSGAAGDVQVYDGGVLLESYEVTANPWATKAAQAVDVLRRYDLKRVHIAAPVQGLTKSDLAAALPRHVDVSVLDLRHEAHSLVHRLQRPGRRTALNKLYEHLVERQPRNDLVTQYAQALAAHGLGEDG